MAVDETAERLDTSTGMGGVILSVRALIEDGEVERVPSVRGPDFTAAGTAEPITVRGRVLGMTSAQAPPTGATGSAAHVMAKPT